MASAGPSAGAKKNARPTEDFPRALRRARAAPHRPARPAARRLEGLGERARTNGGYGRARTLLNTTFRKAKLVQRAAILEAADWLIAIIDRSTMML
jgi:hypothetical protein